MSGLRTNDSRHPLKDVSFDGSSIKQHRVISRPGLAHQLLIAVTAIFMAATGYAGGNLKLTSTPVFNSNSYETLNLEAPGMNESAAVANVTYLAGSYIVNMGVTPQTVSNGLKPYAFVYTLLAVHSVPVAWIINPGKVKDGIDFSHEGVDYKSSAFIIPVEFRSPAVNALITLWQGKGVVGNTIATDLVLDESFLFTTITFAPNWTLDTDNGDIAEDWMVAAEIPITAYTIALPTELGACDDIFVLPHADPTWEDHGNLWDWNLTYRGAIWGGCHGAGALELMFNPLDLNQQTNFLSNKTGPAVDGGDDYSDPENSVIHWNNHGDASAPYNNAYPTDPIMQFLGTTDAAHQNGSERVYLPVLGGSWRATTKIGVWDPTIAEVPAESPGEAAIILYGRGFGDDNRGWVLHEGGHDIFSATAPANVAAVRAFFNFSFLAGKDKAVQIACPDLPATAPGGVAFPVMVTPSPPGSYTYEWSSSCGVFANPSAQSTTFTPDLFQVNTTCVITVRVTDGCGRVSFCSQPFIVECSLPVFSANAAPPNICAGQTSTLSITGLAATFTHGFPSTGGAITILDLANASPFPKTISVAGLPASGVTVKSVVLTGLNHPEPQDLDIYLVGPNAQSIFLISDAGGAATLTNVSFTLQDGGTAISGAAFVNNNTYAPGNLAGGGTEPVPPPALIASLAAFTGNMNGNWSLYIVDDTNVDADGSLASWTINFNEPYTYLWSTGATTASTMVSPLVTTNYTVTVTAGSQCSGTAAVTVNVDVTPPNIVTCPVTRNLEGCNTSVITGPVFSTTTAASSEVVFEGAPNLGNVSDANGVTSVTYIDVANGTCPIVVTRTWTVADACNNSSTCVQTINVDDNTNPVITVCPVLRNIEGCNTSAILSPPFSSIIAASSLAEFQSAPNSGAATDACGVTAVTYIDVSAGTCPTVVTRKWTVIDACGNSATCNQTINVDDNVGAAIIACAVTRNIEGCNTAAITGPAFSTTTAASSEAEFENGTNQGNATDACGITAVTYIDVALGTCPTVVTRKWTISDACGNSATCNQTINVDDTVNPALISCPITRNIEGCNTAAITGPAFSSTTAASSEAEFESMTNQGVASDACGITAVTYIDVSLGTCPTVVTRKWTISDGCGNTATCNQTINVDDNVSPSITTCPVLRNVEGCNTTAILNPPFSATTVASSLAVFQGAPNLGVASDACGVTTVTYRDAAVGTCPTVVTRTWTVGDACGNTATCNQTINVDDTVNPTITACAITRNIEGCNTNAITGPDFNTVTTASSEAEFENGTNQGLISDACGVVSVVFIDVAVGTCPTVVTRKWTISDACGNSATCNQTINVDDTVNPSITTCPVTRNIEGCNTGAITNPPFSATTAASSLAVFQGAPNLGFASDACGVTTVTYRDAAVGTCPTVVTRTWTVGDACGNTATCNQTINVDDNISPSITTCPVTRNIEGCTTGAITNPPFSIITTASSLAVFQGEPNSGVASDACGVTTVTYRDAAVGTCPIVVTRTWTVGDACGNTSTCNQTINVDDNTAPTCVTQNITISIDQESGHTDITAAQINNGSSDLCSSVTLGVSPSTFTCEDDGPNLVTLTVTDACNNTSTCTATVTVESCYNPCITIVGCVNLEGALANPNGSNSYFVPMRTTLNNLRTLPGQTYLDPFFGTPHYTPILGAPGQPFNIPPWNYPSPEGALFNTMGVPGDAGYPATTVDWVLVSIRASADNIVPLCQAAALLHSNGTLQFVQPFDCCDLNLAGSYYLVIEHRNHLIVMSHAPVPIVPGVIQSTLTYSFCNQQSWILDPIFIGIFAQQKEVLPGVFAMLTGNGAQPTSIAATNIDTDDLSVWQNQNGDIGSYRNGDYNLNGDTNGNDRVAWERNNGKFTSVPR